MYSMCEQSFIDKAVFNSNEGKLHIVVFCFFWWLLTHDQLAGIA